MMVSLLLEANAKGLAPSRKIEAACADDVAFLVIAVNRQPGHAALARRVWRTPIFLAGRYRFLLRFRTLQGDAAERADDFGSATWSVSPPEWIRTCDVGPASDVENQRLVLGSTNMIPWNGSPAVRTTGSGFESTHLVTSVHLL